MHYVVMLPLGSLIIKPPSMHPVSPLRQCITVPVITFLLLLVIPKLNGQVTVKKDTVKRTTIQPVSTRTKNSPVTNTQDTNQSDSASRLADQLADELKSIGVQVSDKELQSIADAITKGGSAASNLAIYIMTQVAELKIQNTNPSEPAVQRSTNKLTRANVDKLLQQLKSNKNKNLDLAKFLSPRLVKLKEEDK
jgi:hypothetical protein